MTIGDYLERYPPTGHLAAPVRRQLDQPQLRHLDRPRGGQHRLGRPASHPRILDARGGPDRTLDIGYLKAEHPEGVSAFRFPLPIVPHRRSKGPGRSCTSPRAATGSGGSATITPAPRTPCSITCSASTCRTSTCSSATRRRRSWPGPSAGRPARPLHRAARLSRCEDRRPLYVFRVGQRRPLHLSERTRYDGAWRRRARSKKCIFGFNL